MNTSARPHTSSDSDNDARASAGCASKTKKQSGQPTISVAKALAKRGRGAAPRSTRHPELSTILATVMAVKCWVRVKFETAQCGPDGAGLASLAAAILTEAAEIESYVVSDVGAATVHFYLGCAIADAGIGTAADASVSPRDDGVDAIATKVVSESATAFTTDTDTDTETPSIIVGTPTHEDDDDTSSSSSPPTAPVSVNYARLKVAELRAELSKRDLATTGTKAVLVKRLTEADEAVAASVEASDATENPPIGAMGEAGHIADDAPMPSRGRSPPCGVSNASSEASLVARRHFEEAFERCTDLSSPSFLFPRICGRLTRLASADPWRACWYAHVGMGARARFELCRRRLQSEVRCDFE